MSLNEGNIREDILEANENTSFKLTLSIRDNQKLYFYLDETTALSPYYYERSFTIDELYSLHNIFRFCLSLDKVQEQLLSVIDSKKMFISLKNDDEKLEVKMKVIAFCTPYEIKFNINRSIKKEKNNMLVDLYNKNKNMFDKLKLIQKIVNVNNNLNQKEDLKSLFNKYEIPGIANKVNVKQFCLNWKKKFNLKNQKNVLRLMLKNLTEIVWNKNNVNLFCDPKRSSIKYDKIGVPDYDIGKGQDGDFFLLFPICEKNDYVCVLYLMVNDSIYYEYEIILNITVS